MRRDGPLTLLPLLLWLVSTASAQEPASRGDDVGVELTDVPFDEQHWQLAGGEVVEHLGRTCLKGSALLENVELENGIIEVELAVTGERCFPAVAVRRESGSEYENFYLRPHSPGKPDAVQYAPVFNGQTEWQLCSGAGFTAAAPIPRDTWIHLRLEIRGRQARVFVDRAEQPALRVHDLKREPASAALMLVAPSDGQVHWAGFRYAATDDLAFRPPPPVEPPKGVVTDWLVSQPVPLARLDVERHPAEPELGELSWQEVRCQPSGLVDVSRLHARSAPMPEVVVAKATISSGRAERRKLLFGYSDEVSLFWNGEIVFRGNSAFRSRSASFLGAIGWQDAVFLDLHEGENELLLLVTEDFGGWGFQARWADVGAPAVRIDPSLSEAWVTPRIFGGPESIAFDPERELLYVTNYYLTPAGGTEFVSQVGLDGRLVEGRWITGLDHPTGIAVHGERILFVERTTLTEADRETGEILARHPIPDPGFPNDVTLDDDGVAYVSDGQKGRVYRFGGEEVEVWVEGIYGFQPNGLFAHGGEIYAGDSGEGSVVAIDVETRALRAVGHVGNGAIVDGLAVDGEGRVWTTDYNGRLVRFDPDGARRILLDTIRARHNLADFAYLGDRGVLVFPTLVGGHLRAYTLSE